MTTKTYIDLIGLTRQVTARHEYAEALGLDGEIVGTPEGRLALLGKAKAGAGFTIQTGPEGAAFWLPVSLEVNVRVVPDGTDMSERMPVGREWALRAMGVAPSPAKLLAAREKPPTTKHQSYIVWAQAQRLLDAATGRVDEAPEVIEQFPVEIIYDVEDQMRFLADLPPNVRVAMDGEWEIADTRPGDREIHGVSVSDATLNWYLPVRAADYQPAPDHDRRMREAVMAAIRRTPTIWHNAKADLQALWIGDPVYAYGSPMDDTIVMAYLLGFTDLALKPRTREDLERDPMDYPKDHVGGLATLPLALGARYACADTRNTYDLAILYEEELRKRGRQWDIYESIERPLVPVTASMEWGGTAFDVAQARVLRDNFVAMEQALVSLWWARTHCDISTDRGTRDAIKVMTGYDPGSVAAANLAKVEDVWMDSIMAYRKIRHRRRGFLDKHIKRWEAAGEPADYMIYSNFNQAGSADQHDTRSFKRAPRSGRYSSSGEAGNLQNQPGDIRATFTAPTGYKFWSLDYSGLELNVMAAMSQDAAMLRVLGTSCPSLVNCFYCDVPEEAHGFEHPWMPAASECPHDPKCGDLHDAFRADVLQRTGVAIERTAAKQGNFSGAYGGGADMLVTILAKARAHVDYDTARLIADTRRETFPQSYRYSELTIARARTNGGYSETYFGRRRYDRDLWDGDRQAQAHAERALVNHTIQGTAADVLKIGMMQILPTVLKYGGHISMQVHDEVCGVVPEENADLLISEVRAILESIELPGVALKADGGAGENWEQVH
jgi:DNA polymerase I-like protein with 3'-5' exonuclease and polymerase domains